MNLNFSKPIILKLKHKHNVSPLKLKSLYPKGLLEETREKHQTRPATLWFTRKQITEVIKNSVY